MGGLGSLLWSVVRDLYVVFLLIFLIEQIPGTDLLHDSTRKGVVSVTVVIIVVKLMQFFADPGDTAGVAGHHPARDKKVDQGRFTPAGLEWASAEMQGWRPAMEDATCVVPKLSNPLDGHALFAVFDGHGGAQVSHIASMEFPKVLATCAGNVIDASSSSTASPAPVGSGDGEATTTGDHKSKTTEATVSGGDGEASLMGKSLHLAMLTMDSVLREGGNGLSSKMSMAMPPETRRLVEASGEKRNAFDLVGSTAIVALFELCEESNGTTTSSESASGSAPAVSRRPRRLAVANCGDSRAVLCRKGKALELSEDHKPELKREEERIRGAGGHVAQMGPCCRVDGWGLNLSRALGDFHYKSRSDLPAEKQKVIAVPEIQILDLTEDDEFLVLGCDGIFELNTSQKAVEIVAQEFRAGKSVTEAVEMLVERSCSPNLMKTCGKGGDNCSAIVIRFGAS